MQLYSMRVDKNTQKIVTIHDVIHLIDIIYVAGN